MVSKIILTTVVNGIAMMIVILLMNIFIEKNRKGLIFVSIGMCLYSILASIQEVAVLFRVIINGDLMTRKYLIGTIIICIIIHWLPSMCGFIYQRRKLRYKNHLDEIELVKLKEM